MRLSVASLRRVVKGDLRIEFVQQDLTSYGGLELLRRYVRRMGLATRLRAAYAEMGGDYGGARLSLLILSLFYVGARRLEHLRYLAGDPLITRFCGLARVPSPRTVVNWLKQFTQTTLAPLVQLNQDLVLDTITRLQLPRLTIDVDGTVVCTGATVAWAFRGFNPHHRKVLSYYPLLAHLAQTGHILRLKNRPGNVHDSKQAVAFLRELIDDLRARLGRRVPLEFRMDAAFCQPAIFRPGGPRLCLRHQGRLLALAATQATGRRAAALAAGGTERDGVLPRARHPAVGAAAARDDLSHARPAREPQELPTRPVHAR
jgi:hypothetical protein